MTLVLSFIFAGNFCTAATEDNLDHRKQKSLIDYEKKPTKFENPKDSKNTKMLFFPYRSSLTFRGGGALNFKELNKTDGDKKIPILLGFQYMLSSENSKHQEYGFNLLSGNESTFHLHGGYKYIIDHTDQLRPYYKIGLAMRFDPGDHLETPFDFKSYSIVGSLGVEDVTTEPHSVRIDLDVHWGKEDFLALCAIGWSYAF